nr:PREDICTED: uncharacterized protein LOC105680091 [Linepithema humile]
MDVVDQPELPTVWNWVQENYTLSNFEAICRKCDGIFYFVDTEVLQEHIEDEHKTTYQFEKAQEDNRWKNFRHTGDLNDLQCVVCEKLVSVNDDTSDHPHSAEEGQIVTDISYNWVFKYFKKDCLFSAYCILCKRNEQRHQITAFDKIIFLHFKMLHPEICWQELPFNESLATLNVVHLRGLELFLKACDLRDWKLRDVEYREIAINW